jgi:alpha-glucoside transport system permease protein
VSKFLLTLLTVVIAVGVSGGLWVLANVVFNQARYRWRLFNALCFGAIGFILGAILSGNRLTIGSPSEESGGFLTFIWLPLAAMVVLAAIGMVLEQIEEPRQRLMASAIAGLVVGVAIGLLIREQYWPALDLVTIVVYTAIGIALGVGIDLLRKRPPLHGALTGAAIGFLFGGWGGADLGDGSVVESIIASAVPTILVGVRFGLTTNPDAQRRAAIDRGSRPVIFLAPALTFLSITLVIPAIRTFYLSFLDADSERTVWFDNYKDTFTDKASWNASNWTNMFTSRLFFIGIALLFLAVIVGANSRKKTGRAVEIGNPTVAPLLAGLFFILFATFTSFRGTIINNLWWVLTVVFASTAMGLAIAVLADRSKHEKLAKSLIFMPLAISLVGASVIWRFVYQPRDASVEQTGLFNAAWVGLGRLSTGSGIPTYVVAVLCILGLVGLLVLVARALVARKWGKLALPAIGVLLLGWFTFRYLGSSGVGGVVENAQGEMVPRPVGFVQESPFNNVWLMVILIWIQTGFAMVILSAAIKAVPDEIIEAARVDGATPSQIFWRVTLPQIATTIGVVVTTLIVLVMKVFDIVKVVTNGQFDTQVLANDMYQKAFSDTNIGRGAALAILIFLSVLPVMIYNIRRMQREA